MNGGYAPIYNDLAPGDFVNSCLGGLPRYDPPADAEHLRRVVVRLLPA